MANTFTNPTWIKAQPHGSAEKQVGDSDPSARTDVINRPTKGAWFALRRLLAMLTDNLTIDGSDVSGTTAFTARLIHMVSPQCYFYMSSGTSCLLVRHGGKFIPIKDATGWKLMEIPAAGTSLAVGALSNSTTYFVYAYDNAGTLTLEASTTAWALDTDTGLPIKSGDATRLLVGMVRLLAGAFIDSLAQRFTISFWNRQPIPLLNPITSDISTNSTSFAELSSSFRLEFLTWTFQFASRYGPSMVQVESMGAFRCTGAGAPTGELAIGFDGTTAGDGTNLYQALPSTNVTYHILTRRFDSSLTQGYHDARLLGLSSSGAATIEVNGSATQARRSVLSGVIWG